MRLVFLVAEPVNGDKEDKEEVQERLRREAEKEGDILQPSMEDGHRKLGYKILSGEWSKRKVVHTTTLDQALAKIQENL